MKNQLSAAGLHQRAARRDRDRVRVRAPLEAKRRTGRAGERRCRRARHDVDLLLLGGDLLHRKRDRGTRDVGDHVDAFGVVPSAGDVAGEIGLVLVICGHHFDLLAEHAAAEILDRHFRGFDRPLAAKIGIGSGLVVENADLDALRGRGRARKQSARCNRGKRRLGYPRLAFHASLPVRSPVWEFEMSRPSGSLFIA